jgi:hypothetical protein
MGFVEFLGNWAKKVFGQQKGRPIGRPEKG